ncbi:SIR2 family protein [Mesorhizobium sp. C120A]|uniref:SIR2 family NAD-dependent protein deacylase n=1 Tax=unclassified Mesorhizobium TaxID=325217 RepID=UPI0003FA3C38|nr:MULTISPECIES: SIR2 family protein [unclassified Mesorhizobium]WJI46955.1 SIR2 family protein [Mesorhizobium sp. C120A]
MAPKYLSYFPKPLLDDLVSGRWLPVIGAGMSLNAVLPPPEKMPLWSDLSKYLADELQDYSPTGVLDAISAYEHEFGRTRLIERLSELLHLDKVQPGAAHKEFCSLPFDIVCTTNFDFLLEKQYDRERQDNRSVHPVVDEDQLSINIGAAGILLLKLHGDIRHPKRLVVTESDYDGFLTNYPLIATYLANQLITKTAVFIGYSLDDPDFRQIWHVVASRLGKTRRMAYAIVVNARPGDIARFERRGVKVINLPGTRDRYGQVLAETFAELREYRREHAGPTLKPTEEKPLEQLLLPRDAMTRLCLFATPLDVLPFYKQYIFPLAEAAGFVPVTAADVVNLGESISAKIDTLIDRAAVMVVDATTRNTEAELGLALGRAQEVSTRPNRQPLRVIPVLTDGARMSTDISGIIYIRRPVLLSEDSEFVRALGREFARLAQEMGYAQNLEPRRLFEAKEYRPAVIAAMSLLEAELRQRLDKEPWDKVEGPMSMRQLFIRALRSNRVTNVGEAQIDSWLKLRNTAVHTTLPVGRNEAKAVVEGVERILDLRPA